jgi:ankyrin repeat protein
LVDLLLQHGADANLANVAGVTPLMAASFKGNPAIVAKLLAAGAQVDTEDRVKKNAAIYAAGSGCTECLRMLMQKGMQPNARFANELTLLMWAAGYGHDETARFLLDQGADPKLKDNRGKTAADIARDGNYLALASLLEKGGK